MRALAASCTLLHIWWYSSMVVIVPAHILGLQTVVPSCLPQTMVNLLQSVKLQLVPKPKHI